MSGRTVNVAVHWISATPLTVIARLVAAVRCWAQPRPTSPQDTLDAVALLSVAQLTVADVPTTSVR